jgi:FkbH-like protein
MKLIEALEIVGRPIADKAPELRVFLACGFTPLHLQTFMAADLRVLLPEARVAVKTGLFGDLSGSIERLEPSGVDSLAVVIEWSDIDPRLGVRTLGGWRPTGLPGIVKSGEEAATRLRRAIADISCRVPTVVCMPTLPLPPMFATRRTEESSFEAQLHHTVASLAESLSRQSGLRVANAQFLYETSPTAGRYDVKSDLVSGFPYTLRHASAVGEVLASLINARTPKKGLITDLDDTLWAGILGDDGVDEISWHLDRRSQMHGLYQQVLASLASAGVLLGVASKNDLVAVESAFERSDLAVSKSDIFPFETHWSPKSESVQRILETWNVSADSVVFVDNSPIEVAEVGAAFPAMECIVFPKDDYQGILELLKRLRDLFGKSVLTEEDTLRLSSIRDAGAWRDLVQSSQNSADEFLKAAEAHIIFDFNSDSGDLRAFELVNKTNQFNLNGKRFSESEWRSFLGDPASFLLTASYKDKYGTLGKIAVIAGRVHEKKVYVNSWVMSCRAFSRRIEHQCLQYLFETLAADEIVFDYEVTPRNGALRDFFMGLLASHPVPGANLTRDEFAVRVPRLFHRVEGTVHV